MNSKLKKNLGKLVVLVIAAIIAALGGFNNEDSTTPPKQNPPISNPFPSNPDEENVQLTYKGKTVKLTRHAECRMDCREIDRSEVQEILNNGRVNDRKSDPSDKPCPTFALEGKSHDGQTCRVVIAECERVVKVITVIDLGNKYECVCD